jgi:hypothetical protein
MVKDDVTVCVSLKSSPILTYAVELTKLTSYLVKAGNPRITKTTMRS